MAEINTPAVADKGGKRRRKILSTKVDLTPMVDLGFLLITFFIFTTKMHESKTMDLVMPKDSPDSTNVGNTGALTVIPMAGDKIFYYHGSLQEAMQSGAYGTTSWSVKDGIGQVIRDKQIYMDRYKKGSRKDLVLMIKPTNEAKCRNVVDILDEVVINGLSHYALMNITEEELTIIAEKATGSVNL